MLDFNGKITPFFLLLFTLHYNGKFLCVLKILLLEEFYNHITSGEKREIITRGFERAGITHALELGSSKLPELDPFAEFSTLVSGNELLDQSLPDEEYLQSFTNERVHSDDSDWGEDFDRNVFEDVID